MTLREKLAKYDWLAEEDPRADEVRRALAALEIVLQEGAPDCCSWHREVWLRMREIVFGGTTT